MSKTFVMLASGIGTFHNGFLNRLSVYMVAESNALENSIGSLRDPSLLPKPISAFK